MTTTNRNLLLVLLGGVILGIAIFFVFGKAPNNAASGSQNATTTAQGTVATSTSQGAQASAQDVLKSLDIRAMVSLARDQKNAGNYDAAIATLTRAAQTFPGEVVANNNLGDIYMNFKKDYPKAEAAYKAVIKTNPQYLDAYRHLLELYTTTSYKPTNTAAADIVTQALKALPKAYDLELILARYYRDIGETAKARAEYRLAIDNAKGQGLASVAADMQAELDKIPQ